MIVTKLTQSEIRPEQVLDLVDAPHHGAVLLFLGVVRDHNEGRAVTSIGYEAYGDMASRVLDEIAREAAERTGVGGVAVVHRVGRLSVGAVSVAIAISSPHRDEAYRASRYVIEEIKERLPVWKEEHYADGGRSWIVGRRARGTSEPEGTEEP